MKKLTFYLLISIIALFLLFPAFASAQKSKSKSKVKTVSIKSKSKAKTSTAANRQSKAVLEEGLNNTGALRSGEPTEAEMKQAVIRTMQRRGATKRDDDTVSVDNPLAGSSIKIEEFEKLGCKLANYGAGYFCTYGVTIAFNLYSNEGTTAGNNHANAVNMLMRMLNGGKNSSYETVTSRFIRSKQGWIMSKD